MTNSNRVTDKVTWDQAKFSQFSFILSYVLPLKLGLMRTLTSLCCLRPDFARNAEWLLEQCHRIWLAVGINGIWKRLFLGEWSAVSGEKDFAVFFIVLRSCGRKICLKMYHGNSENSLGCSYLLRICCTGLAFFFPSFHLFPYYVAH